MGAKQSFESNKSTFELNNELSKTIRVGSQKDVEKIIDEGATAVYCSDYMYTIRNGKIENIFILMDRGIKTYGFCE